MIIIIKINQEDLNKITKLLLNDNDYQMELGLHNRDNKYINLTYSNHGQNLNVLPIGIIDK